MGKAFIIDTYKKVKIQYLFIILFAVIMGIAAISSYLYYASANIYGQVRFKDWLQNTLQDRRVEVIDAINEVLDYGRSMSKRAQIPQAFDHPVLSKEEIEQLKKFFDSHGTIKVHRATILINPKGTVLFSDISDKYIGVSLSDFKQSPLYQSFMRVMMTSTYDIAKYEYDPVLQRPALFVSIPLFKDNKIVGVFVLEVSPSVIYDILHNYLGLGTTGDMTYGVEAGGGVLLISGSRQNYTKPFKEFKSYLSVGRYTDFPLMNGVQGKTGTGIKEYDDTKAIASWGYIPFVDWGIAAHKDINEINKANRAIAGFALIFFLLFALTLFGLVYKMDMLHRWFFAHGYHLFWLCVLGISIFLTYKGITVAYAQFAKRQAGKENVRSKIDHGAQEIYRMLDRLAGVGYAIAEDLSSHALKKEDIIKRMELDLKQIPDLYGITIAFEPYQFTAAQRLYAPYMYRANGATELQFVDKVYDYVAEELETGSTAAAIQTWSWYASAKKSNALVWLSHYMEGDKLLSGYSLPFYKDHHKKEIAGVVNIVFDTSLIQRYVRYLEIGHDGYTILLGPLKTFMYNPQREYVVKQYTLLDIAEREDNASLAAVAQQLQQGKEGYHTFFNNHIGEETFLYAKTIPKVNWMLCGIFSTRELDLPNTVTRQYYMQLILIALILCTLLFVGLSRIFSLTTFIISYGLSVLMVAGFLTLLWLIIATPEFDQVREIKLIDQNRLKRFLYEKDLRDQKIHEPVTIKIPTGIELNNVAFPTTGSMELAGYIWQHYPIEMSDIARDIRLESIDITRLRKLYEIKTDHTVIIGWKFVATVAQRFDYHQYPFDSIALHIGINYPGFDKPVFLIPSLEDYKNLRPEALPGFFKGFSIAGFNMYKSFFVYSEYENTANLGLQKLENEPQSKEFAFKVLLTRNLLYDFIVFFLPILLVFFLIYAIFILQEREKTRLFIISGYTGLVFAVTLLHRSLRERMRTGDILYIEYLFFMLYIIFVLLALYILIRPLTGRFIDRIKAFLEWYRVFFWPIQVAIFIVITTLIFY